MRTSALHNRITRLEAALAPSSKPIVAMLPTPHTAQARILNEAKRFNVVCLGRRAGKTTLGIDLLVRAATEGKPVAWLSPTYKMMTDVWRGLRGVLFGHALRISDVDKRIDLSSGGVIELWSLERSDAIRGRKYARVIIDEAAMVRDLKYVWSTVIRPTLVDLKGDAFFFSTPKGRNGFWQLWQTADADGWGRWQMPSHVNPHIPRSELDAMARDLPERVYRQEVDAQFLDDEGAVFRNVQACVGDASHTGTTIFGIDVGRTDDYTVCVVIDAKTKGVLAIDRYTGVSFIQQEQRILAMAERWKPAAIIVEVNNFGLPFAESLAQKQLPVVPFTTTNASKQVIIDHLSLGFERQALTIPNDHILIGELMSFEMSKTATGLMRFAAPDGQHDDTVMALAFAYYGTGNY